jgi:hypothetical protein
VLADGVVVGGIMRAANPRSSLSDSMSNAAISPLNAREVVISVHKSQIIDKCSGVNQSTGI